MKIKFFLLFVIIATMWQIVQAQPIPQDTSDIVWQKYIWPQACGDAKFSSDGNIIYANIESQIIKLSSKTGDSLGIFDGKASMYVMDYSGGRYIATTTGTVGANIWDVQQEKLIKSMQYGIPGYGIPTSISISPDDRFVLICLALDTGQNIVVYDPNTDKELTRFQCKGTPLSVKFSHDGTNYAIVSWYKDALTEVINNSITLWETGTWKQIDEIYNRPGSQSGNFYLSFSYDDKMVSTSSFFIDIKSKVIFKPNNGTNTPSYMYFYPDNIHCFTLYGSNDLWWVNLFTGITNKRYIIFGGRIDCDKNSNQVFAHDAYTLTLLKPTATSVNPPNLLKENLIIYNDIKKLNIELTTNHIGNPIVTIYNLTGNNIYQQDLGFINGVINKYSIDINLPLGVYICRIQTNNDIGSVKIIIEK